MDVDDKDGDGDGDGSYRGDEDDESVFPHNQGLLMY